MKLSDDIRDVADEEHYSVTAKLYNGWADEVAQLEAELAECRETLGEWLEKHDVRIDELETENETLRGGFDKGYAKAHKFIVELNTRIENLVLERTALQNELAEQRRVDDETIE